MAYAALTSLARVIDQILPLDQKYVSLCGKDQMKSLHEKISLLLEFLEYISMKSFLPADYVLESRIRDTAYKMEDIIELVILSDPGKECESEVQLPTTDEFSSYFEEFHVLLEETMEIKKNLDNNAMPGKHTLTTTTLSREAPCSEGTKVGLEKALNQILDQVTRQGSKLRIVPITGMGGIGKTTLAKASYEAPQTLHHFDIRFWVTVSQECNIQEILRGLLPVAERTKHRDEHLIEHVHKYLTGRRYLLVLDDMWDEKVWDRVRNAFPDDNKGSRVILTTRLLGVASYVGSSSPVHEMQFLNEDQSWDLLRKNVYGHQCCSTEFECLGRKIARNCKGLPLAVVVIAGLLKFNKSGDYWGQVAQNTNEKVTTSNDHLFGILCWSYTRLPPHLKACFLYMGAFKEDYEITTEELVMLWAAEGFLKPKQTRSMEEAAEEYLEELVERSLVLVTKKWYNGKIRTCSVHDVMREVSIRKAKDEKFHPHFEHDTLFVTTHSLIDQKKVRVLNKARVEKDSQLSILCILTNLRYLHFVCKDTGNTSIIIPKQISELQNLETLIVSSRLDIRFVFPLEIWNLQRLRHIVMKKGHLQVPIPNRCCPSLQTLDGLTNINFSKSFAERISNLKKLKLIYKDDKRKYTLNGLRYLHQLEELSIFCQYGSDRVGPTRFVFPQNLKKLSLYGTKIPLENLSPIGLLPSLKVLKLKRGSVEGSEWEPNEGEFLQLEKLKMDCLPIHQWSAESIHFPHLRKLVILQCLLLEEVPESIGEIDTLEMLIVEVREGQAKRSVQKIKENQQDMGNDLLQVTIILNTYPFIWKMYV